MIFLTKNITSISVEEKTIKIKHDDEWIIWEQHKKVMWDQESDLNLSIYVHGNWETSVLLQIIKRSNYISNPLTCLFVDVK